jgi:UDP-glucose 4-epimerase
MIIEGKRFLVTGGAGFIGSHLVDSLLSTGAEHVRVFDNCIRGGPHNLSHLADEARLEMFAVRGDLRQTDELDAALADIDGVFHLASVCLAHCQEFPQASIDSNIVGTFNLLEACTRAQVRRVIFASSSSVYGNARYTPMDEEHPFDNRNFYGASKIAGEAICKAFYHKYGIDYANLRFMNIYGPRQDYKGAYVAVIMKIIDRLIAGERPIIYGDGSQSFDFVYVEDCCHALLAAMVSQATDTSFNISSGTQTSILQLAEDICRLMGREPEIEFVEREESAMVQERVGSTEKAQTELGFSCRVSLQQGLHRVLQWRRQEAE